MTAIEANGIIIEYEEQGSGEPLLLVMGLAGQLTDWPPGFVVGLADRGFRVIRFDNRDIGLSTEFTWKPPTRARSILDYVLRRRPPAGYQIEDMATDAGGLLSAMDIEAAHVVGVSMGGMIGQAMAIHQPSRVLSLTSIMSNTGDQKHGRPTAKLVAKALRLPDPTRETAAELSTETFRLISGPDFDEAEHFTRARASVDRSYRPVGVLRQTAAIAASPDRTEDLARVSAPTLVIHGLVDPLVRPSGGMATSRAVPGSRLLMFPDMGHDLPAARWSEMIDAIEANAARAGQPISR